MSVNLIVDEAELGLPGNSASVVEQLTEAVAVPDPAASVVPDDVAPAPAALPEKYAGKTVEDIVAMHQNLESAYGRMANDLGTQRKLTDQLLDLKREEDLTRNSPEPLAIDSGDLFDNPTEIVGKVVDAKVKGMTDEAINRISALEGQLAEERFLTKHSDFNDITASGEFNDWLSRSPIRLQYGQAAAQGDYSAAMALLDDYKDYQSHVTPPQAPATTSTQQDPLHAARQAALETGKSSTASAAKATGKIYRRADLIDLKLRDPETYNSPDYQAEIVRAYQEGRVK